MSKVYALLVGINEYVAVTPLHGCVEDITAVESLFRSRIPAESLELRVLRDADATRQGIIDGFRTHLARAGGDDFALFYYCGHGSQEDCPPEWLRLEPSGRNQTIVPVDARTGDVFDLADKELNALIHEVAEGGGRVITIFDSCHSGGVTRNVEDEATAGVPRMTQARRDRQRTLDDYLDLTRTLYDPVRVAESGPPEPRHIAIAACQHNETAKEFPRQPPRRGAFSMSFEEALRSLGPAATYVDLVSAIRSKVRDRASDQMPNLFVSAGASGREVFLAGQAGRRDLTVDADAAGRWWLSAGALDGIPTPEGGEATEIDFLPRGAFDDPQAAVAPVARGVVDLVEPDRSRVRVVSGLSRLSPTQQYLGTITRLGAPAALVVALDAALPPELAARARARLEQMVGRFSVGAASEQSPTVTVSADGDELQLLGADGAPIAGLRFATTDAGLGALAAACAHLGQWYGTRDRAFMGSTLNDAVRIELVPLASHEKIAPDDREALPPDAPGALTLHYDGEQPPRVQIRLRNSSRERLYVALLDLTNTFECSSLFADWIPAGGTGFVKGGKGLKLQIPAWPTAQAPMATDDFKLFAALTDFDAERWSLPALVGPDARGATRAVVDDDEDEVSAWGTSALHVEIRRDGDAAARA